jgi:hypothetical protein
MLVVLTTWHNVVLLLHRDSQMFTGEKKEGREEKRENKKEKKNIAIHFLLCLFLRFFCVQINLHKFNQ